MPNKSGANFCHKKFLPELTDGSRKHTITFFCVFCFKSNLIRVTFATLHRLSYALFAVLIYTGRPCRSEAISIFILISWQIFIPFQI